MHKTKLALLVVVVIAIVYILWTKDHFNRSWLPLKFWHKTIIGGFIGLNRAGQYTMRPGGAPGVPGIDINTSDWV